MHSTCIYQTTYLVFPQNHISMVHQSDWFMSICHCINICFTLGTLHKMIVHYVSSVLYGGNILCIDRCLVRFCGDNVAAFGVNGSSVYSNKYLQLG